MSPFLYLNHNFVVSIELYRVGPMPLCQIVYAHFDVLVPHLDGNMAEIEHKYVEMVQHAIQHGMLEESLETVDPQEKHTFHIEGVGKHRYPLENMHGGNGEGRRLRTRK